MKKLFSFLVISAIAVSSACLFSAYNFSVTDTTDSRGQASIGVIPNIIFTDLAGTGGGTPKCYNEKIIPCYEGGITSICDFTGVYGSPYTCTSFYCDNIVPPRKRMCVPKK